MALWMENGSEPLTDSEKADLDAIAALKQSSALELKEKGNQFVKMGKKHYSDAIDCYTRAIDQKALTDHENSVLFGNRALANLLLGNYRRALSDSEDAVKLSPSNVKALYRAAKACLSLNLLSEAKVYCENALEHDSSNEDVKKLLRQIDLLKSEKEQRETQVSIAVEEAKSILSAIESRGYKIGKGMLRDLVGLKKPVLDKENVLHWPVVFLLPEVMSSDLIEDFCVTDMFSAHLDRMFSDNSPLDSVPENSYTRDRVELYYEAAPGGCLSKKEILHYLLEGTAAAHVADIGDEENSAVEDLNPGVSAIIPCSGASKWVKVDEKRTLDAVLKEPKFIIQEIPVFYIVSKKTDFYKKFKAGLWALPS